MRLYSDKLAQHLQQQLLPVYLISGDEPLLLQECCDLVRQKAREEGCNEREIIEASVSSFNWQDILHSASNMSLFASRKLIEVRLPSGKPGVEGSKALCEYLDIASDDDVLLIVSGKIDKQSTNSKWYKSLDKAGVGPVCQSTGALLITALGQLGRLLNLQRASCTEDWQRKNSYAV